MPDHKALLRHIPQIDSLLGHERAGSLAALYSPKMVTEALRDVLAEVRAAILAGGDMPDEATLFDRCEKRLSAAFLPAPRPLINGTGIVLHTNLGRAPLSKPAVDAMIAASQNYCDVEYDLRTGERGHRAERVAALLCELVGAEDAIVVNNNAAAVLLMLSALAKSREVVVSRGELVEIGGSFRVPEVMAESGCQLVEVGATNKTHHRDYQNAITDNTAALLKVHTSNYRIVGFTEEVSLKDLSDIAKAAGLPLLCDVGSGALLSLSPYGLTDEPTVQDCLRQGADLVCFSGDKLLGGPQAGIIVGKSAQLAPLKKHPLMRAFRADKTVLAGLYATLCLYRDPDLARRAIHLYALLGQGVDTLHHRAQALCARLTGLAADITPVNTSAQLGGGSTPGSFLPSVALGIVPKDGDVDALKQELLNGADAVVSRVYQGQLLIDLITVFPEQEDRLVAALEAALSGGQA